MDVTNELKQEIEEFVLNWRTELPLDMQDTVNFHDVEGYTDMIFVEKVGEIEEDDLRDLANELEDAAQDEFGKNVRVGIKG